MTAEPTLAWVALNKVRGLTPRLRATLLDAFGDPEGIARAAGTALRSIPGLPPRALSDLGSMATPRSLRLAREEVGRAHRLGAAVLTCAQREYPDRLREGLADPPPVLYVQGTLQLGDDPAVAIVGSRRCSAYGAEVARRLAFDLASRGYTVVSGLARGIDTAAHRGALEAGGRTLAVLGCGIDWVYPAANAGLTREIASRGALLSEFPLGSRPLAFHFPIRNRIISGLSRAVIVVEAAEASGSLITARLAAEQGREVGAVPGAVTSPLSVGANLLIKDGACLVRGWQDVEDLLPDHCKHHPDPSGDTAAELGERARRILEALSPTAPRHIDVVASDLRESAGNLLIDLLDLELKRLVVSLPGKHFLKRA
ncbi:MAG: DNA-processing protein DprA [Acidobacteriota bacterium]